MDRNHVVGLLKLAVEGLNLELINKIISFKDAHRQLVRQARDSEKEAFDLYLLVRAWYVRGELTEEALHFMRLFTGNRFDKHTATAIAFRKGSQTLGIHIPDSGLTVNTAAELQKKLMERIRKEKAKNPKNPSLLGDLEKYSSAIQGYLDAKAIHKQRNGIPRPASLASSPAPETPSKAPASAEKQTSSSVPVPA